MPGFAKGASITLNADFAPLAHPDNNNLGNVNKITVMADLKGMVKESNENNNTKEKPVPCPEMGGDLAEKEDNKERR